MVDKIQSANELLFAMNSFGSDIGLKSAIIEETTDCLERLRLQSKHRVTFSSDVENIDNDGIECTENAEEIYESSEDRIAEEINAIFDRIDRENGDRSQFSAEDTEISRSRPWPSGMSPANCIAVTRRTRSEPEKRRPGIETDGRFAANGEKKSTKVSRENTDNAPRIRFGIRKCCESQPSVKKSLPRYSGYLSQYGLSKDQLKHRERNMILLRQRNKQQTSENVEIAKQKYEDNEKAFRLWLHEKQKSQKPKNRNMFDFNKNTINA